MPYYPFAIAILLRGVGSWLGVRIAMAVVGGIYGVEPSVGLGLLASLGVVVVATAIVVFELTRLNERLFLANLGVQTSVLVGLAAVPPTVLETAATALAP